MACAKPKISTALNKMAAQTVALGARQSRLSKSNDSTAMKTAVNAVIQKEIVSVGSAILVRRSNCVPSAQVDAATSASATPPGWPASPVNSFHSSSVTPNAAALTPSQPRRVIAVENSSAPITAEKIGIV